MAQTIAIIAEMVIALTVERFAELFQFVAIIMIAFIVPHSLVCLAIYENHPAVRYARIHKDSGYWWSLMTWSWYVKLSTAGLSLLLIAFFIRVFNKYDVVVENLPPQPDWSYFLSMSITVLLLCILWMPSLFFLYIKHEIRHDERIRKLVSEETQRET